MVSPRVFIVAVAVLGILVGRLACSSSLACSTLICSVWDSGMVQVCLFQGSLGLGGR